MSDTVQTSLSPSSADPRVANRERFELELEFVQALANPFYLHSLAQQGILNQPSFIHFLDYLQYWRKKDYARFIHYPHALHHLELLQHAQFRQAIGRDEWRESLNQKQFDHWRTWREPQKQADAVQAEAEPQMTEPVADPESIATSGSA